MFIIHSERPLALARGGCQDSLRGKMLCNFDNSYYDYSPYTELSKKSFNKLLAYRNF